MKQAALDMSGVLSAASRAKQLFALLETIFENGTQGCQADDELVGLAYDLSSKIMNDLAHIESELKINGK
ncbi:hypothetical protein [Pantoea stewartii]|uniref:Phage protein n=1 Tax=Pantoea stewartii subsp. stewartii DC283 TaxID=660596 RepID=A0ABM6K9Q7_PANSE|nr:hypothetical protein [Pantoea stewartii]ARF51121.1 hypothetical protein DSJ_18570 [Pantoea stewartii subsp. stewartii DC283]KAB0555130.1 hypothetical protein F7Q90_09955 [Pantoea stewartii subsp. stewartii]